MGSTATPTKPITTTLSYQDIRQIHTGLTMEMTKAKRITKTKTIVRTQSDNEDYKDKEKTKTLTESIEVFFISVIIFLFFSKTPPLADSSTERDLLNDSEGEFFSLFQQKNVNKLTNGLTILLFLTFVSLLCSSLL